MNDRYGCGFPSSPVWKTFGADDRPDHAQERAQDAVLVEAGHRVERLLDLGGDPVRVLAILLLGVEAGDEQLYEQTRDLGVPRHRALDV